jgi:hypothetical protein
MPKSFCSSSSSAPSVLEPFTIASSAPLAGITLAVELTDTPSAIKLTKVGGRSEADGASRKWSPAAQAATTVIRFCVRVPVLSEQMLVALPMVSQAASTRMRLLSSIIFCVE